MVKKFHIKNWIKELRTYIQMRPWVSTAHFGAAKSVTNAIFLSAKSLNIFSSLVVYERSNLVSNSPPPQQSNSLLPEKGRVSNARGMHGDVEVTKWSVYIANKSPEFSALNCRSYYPNLGGYWSKREVLTWHLWEFDSLSCVKVREYDWSTERAVTELHRLFRSRTHIHVLYRSRVW